MKIFFQKLFLWLPLAFLILVLADMFFIHEYFFKTRYSILQTPAFAGLTLSFLIASISETMNKESKHGLRKIYKWYVALPVILILIALTLASMNK
jgi:hypothetical protein